MAADHIYKRVQNVLLCKYEETMAVDALDRVGCPSFEVRWYFRWTTVRRRYANLHKPIERESKLKGEQ